MNIKASLCKQINKKFIVTLFHTLKNFQYNKIHIVSGLKYGRGLSLTSDVKISSFIM